jgi:hypothetical protein
MRMPGTRRNSAPAESWFEEYFGFAEGDYEETRAQFDFADFVLTSRRNHRSYYVGPFETLSLEDLRSSLTHQGGSLTFRNICGDARTLHGDPANAGAVFQVASLFNCLEMVGPGTTPQAGVTGYAKDATQGPSCAVMCPAATVYRNYVHDGGAGRRQVNCLGLVESLVGNQTEGYWEMKNGYAMPREGGSIAQFSQRLADPAFAEAVRSKLQVGVHWDTQVKDKSHRVVQVFSSALPLNYCKGTSLKDWEPFAKAVLDATFEATLAAAALVAQERGERVKVFLTAVGGGALGNQSLWIANAITRALELYACSPLDVMLVHVGSSLPRGPYQNIAKNFSPPKDSTIRSKDIKGTLVTWDAAGHATAEQEDSPAAREECAALQWWSKDDLARLEAQEVREVLDEQCMMLVNVPAI